MEREWGLARGREGEWDGEWGLKVKWGLWRWSRKKKLWLLGSGSEMATNNEQQQRSTGSLMSTGFWGQSEIQRNHASQQPESREGDRVLGVGEFHDHLYVF